MGRYVVRADLAGLIEERDLVQLTNDLVSASTVDDDILDLVVAEAEDEVDGYLAARHTLPLASVPTLVTRLAARITRFRLHTRRPGSIGEWLQKDYDNAIGMLKSVRDGKLSLGVPEPAANPERVIRVNGRAPVFGRKNCGGF